MREDEERLSRWCLDRGLAVRTHLFERSVGHSGAAAAEACVSMDRVVKTVLLRDSQGRLYAAIVRGHQRVRTRSIKQGFGVRDVSLVPGALVREACGYPAGGVPPFGFDATFILDAGFLADEVVLAGGGSVNALIEVRIADIQAATRAITLPIACEMSPN
jgi:prolyl-tRNA editing enzyme YbaK/EbsC (Cys-tRNA(Pro) deacylase)